MGCRAPPSPAARVPFEGVAVLLVFFTFFFARSPLDSRAASLRDRFETVAGATGDGLAVRVSSRGSPPLALMTLFWWRTFLYPFRRNRFAASESLW